uniref:Uncharacterized protein n=1 Tax=Rhizophora mucronata TaxID=61149 RepID=A0A2P2P8U8_RHIMU
MCKNSTVSTKTEHKNMGESQNTQKQQQQHYLDFEDMSKVDRHIKIITHQRHHRETTIKISKQNLSSQSQPTTKV